MAEHNQNLILIPERITLSPRAYMQFHNQERQLISLCEIQKCHAATETDINYSAGFSRFPLLYPLYSLFQRTCVCVWHFLKDEQRTCVSACYSWKGEQPPSASVYGWVFLARQPRAGSANVTASACAAPWTHQRPQGHSQTACTSPPRQSQCVWTLKMGAPRVRLKERGITCAAKHD